MSTKQDLCDMIDQFYSGAETDLKALIKTLDESGVEIPESEKERFISLFYYSAGKLKRRVKEQESMVDLADSLGTNFTNLEDLFPSKDKGDL